MDIESGFVYRALMNALTKMSKELEAMRNERDWWQKEYITESHKNELVNKPYNVYDYAKKCDDPTCKCNNDGSAPEPNPIDEHGYDEMIEKTLAKDVGESGEAI